MDVLRKEIPLLSKLLLDSSGKSEDIMYRIKEVGKLNSFDNHNSDNELNKQITDNQSTKYSSINSVNIQFDIKQMAAQEDLESSKVRDQCQNKQEATEISNVGLDELEIDATKNVQTQDTVEYDLSVKDNSTLATEISNIQSYDATKNSDSSNSINIARCFPNPLTNTPISHENPDKSIQNDLISEWAGSDSNQRAPPCQGGILTSNVKDVDNKQIADKNFWNGYRIYLQRIGTKTTVNDRFNYSIKYFKYLYDENSIGELLTFSPNKRLHIMKALSTLSKFTGRHDLWKQTIKKYNLLWSTGDNSLSIFNKIVNETSYSEMLKWIKNVISEVPAPQANLFMFNTLTGLRPVEVSKSINLIHLDLENYWNKEKGILEHYKFPDEFSRRTKKVFISVVDKPLIKLAKDCPVNISYNALKLMLKRKGLDMNMYYCRKVFATFLRNEGIEPEIIDLLQGRIPNSVFVRHYYRPDSSKFDTVRKKLTKLHDLLLQS